MAWLEINLCKFLLCGDIDAKAMSFGCQISHIVLDVTFHQTAGIHINPSRQWEHFITVHFWNNF